MLKILLLTAALCAACESYKILLLFPVASRSHHNLGIALVKGLTDAGHDVTFVSPYEDKFQPKNGSYREVVLTGIVEEQEGSRKNFDNFNYEKQSIVKKVTKVINLVAQIVTKVFEHDNFQKLINSNETFDATIVEHFIADAVKVIPSHFNSHQIILSPMGSSAWVDFLVGNPALPSYVPEILTGLPVKMNFWQRIVNTIATGLIRGFQCFYLLPIQDALVKNYFPNSINVYEELYNVSLILLNGHYSLIHPQNRVPNMIDIGGYHLKGPKPLPKGLQEYLDNSKNGVVYFSMGSVVKSKTIPLKTRNLILKSLGSLNEDVLWKWEEDNLPGQPKNVKIEKWVPQESVLAHPNVKLFITHGGLLSTIETTYYGKPILALPIFGDQKSNAAELTRNGLGEFINFSELEEKKFTQLIREIIDNQKYAETAKQKSAIMRDRQVDPLQTAVYWVEYVIRHNGAKHLRVAALDLRWYEYYLLDVIGFLVLVLFVSLFITKKMFSFLFCKNKDSNEKTASKKIKKS